MSEVRTLSPDAQEAEGKARSTPQRPAMSGETLCASARLELFVLDAAVAVWHSLCESGVKEELDHCRSWRSGRDSDPQLAQTPDFGKVEPYLVA